MMDDVQFQKNGLQNRNIIKTPTGNSYLTLPVFSKSNILINEVNIANEIYIKKILKTLKQNYVKSRYFDFVFDNINELVKQNNYNKLHELNKDLILLSLKLMKAKVDLKFSSDFNLSSKKDDLILELILSLKQNKYIMGSGGLNYMDLDKFKNNNIELYQYKFNYRKYNQLWPKIGFVKDLSIIDLLFNELESAKDYILSNGSLELLKDNK